MHSTPRGKQGDRWHGSLSVTPAAILRLRLRSGTGCGRMSMWCSSTVTWGRVAVSWTAVRGCGSGRTGSSVSTRNCAGPMWWSASSVRRLSTHRGARRRSGSRTVWAACCSRSISRLGRRIRCWKPCSTPTTSRTRSVPAPSCGGLSGTTTPMAGGVGGMGTIPIPGCGLSLPGGRRCSVVGIRNAGSLSGWSVPPPIPGGAGRSWPGRPAVGSPRCYGPGCCPSWRPAMSG